MISKIVPRGYTSPAIRELTDRADKQLFHSGNADTTCLDAYLAEAAVKGNRNERELADFARAQASQPGLSACVADGLRLAGLCALHHMDPSLGQALARMERAFDSVVLSDEKRKLLGCPEDWRPTSDMWREPEDHLREAILQKTRESSNDSLEVTVASLSLQNLEEARDHEARGQAVLGGVLALHGLGENRETRAQRALGGLCMGQAGMRRVAAELVDKAEDPVVRSRCQELLESKDLANFVRYSNESEGSWRVAAFFTEVSETGRTDQNWREPGPFFQ